MHPLITTKMSSRGQVVIPEDIRHKLGLESGTRFVVMADKEKDVIILKLIIPPVISDFSEVLAKTHKIAKTAGRTKKDLENAIKETRRKK